MSNSVSLEEPATITTELHNLDRTLCWNILVQSTCFINPRFEAVLSSQERLSEVYDYSNVKLCNGLLSMLRSPVPPTLDQLLGITPIVPKDAWGVYLLIFEKSVEHMHLRRQLNTGVPGPTSSTSPA